MLSLKVLKISCAVVCGFASIAFAAEPAATDPVQGVWQKHDYNFQFVGFTTTYSCEGLASKLKLLLVTAGARADAKSVSSGCSRGYGIPDKFARSRLTFYTLAPSQNAENPGASIHGAWRSVVIAERSPRDLALGDCELVEQFRDKVLPMFRTRNIDNHMTCVPNQVSGSVISLKFEVLAGLPVAKKQ
jgi:hypothetical protein